jgi:hypothetical protein
MKNRIVFLLAAILAGTCVASDKYVIQAEGPLVHSQNPCMGFQWLTDLLFFNTTSTEQTVTLVGVSNGEAQNPRPLSVPSNQVVEAPFTDLNWAPVPYVGPFTAHLSVPAGVLVRSRIEPTGFSVPGPCSPFPGYELLIRGALPLPVFSQLIPAGQAQYFLAADLGHLTNVSYATLYNAATTQATISFEVRRQCNGDLLASESFVVPPNTTLQVPATGDYAECDGLPEFGRYVVVTADQPGFAIVSVVDDDPFKKMSMSILAPDF